MSKILVIEDDKTVRTSLEYVLKTESYEVIIAQDGEEGIKLAKSSLPDLIICDIMMPKLNGYQVLKEMRTHEATAAIPFIFLTAKIQKKDLRRGMNLGADDYITKPFAIDEILTSIRTRLEKRDELTEKIRKGYLNISQTLPHELRTPLTTIKGYAEILSEAKNLQIDIDTVTEWGKVIYESELRLERIAENYGFYANFITKGKDAPEISFWKGSQEVFTKPIIKNITLQKAEKYDRQDDVVFDLSDFGFKISVHSFMKILDEILDNAFKFSSNGSEIEISNQTKESYFILNIKDHGIGMPHEQIQNIGPFIQFEREKYEQQGSGLGLYIAKYLTEINDGELNINSQKEQGTTVSLKFKTT